MNYLATAWIAFFLAVISSIMIYKRYYGPAFFAGFGALAFLLATERLILITHLLAKGGKTQVPGV